MMGLLFLDEVGELGADEQAALLRAIEEGVFRPVGSQKEKHSSFLLICGTNRDLAAEVQSGRFREDLLAGFDGLPQNLIHESNFGRKRVLDCGFGSKKDR